MRREFELRGRDEHDLERRLATFRQAIRAQRGAILDIRWRRSGPRLVHSASVLYQLPLGGVDSGAPGH